MEVRYGPVPALRDVSMEIRRGEIVCLLGGNASGKSTTMKTVIGSVRPAKGSIWYDGEDITGWNTFIEANKSRFLRPAGSSPA